MLQRLHLSMPFASFFLPFIAVDLHAEESDALSVNAVYTADLLSNLDGGIETGTRYLDNLDLQLEIDGEKALRWSNATLFVHALYNNGTRFSETLVGDAHIVSNIEAGVSAIRLYEAWIDQRFWHDRLSVRTGLYDLNSEFDAVETAALFINSAHGIGTEFGQTGVNGPSIFPVTSIAFRASVQLSDAWTLRAVLLDGIPGDPNHPKRTAVKLGNGDGALIVGEVDYHSDRWRIIGGHWRYTSRFDDIVTGVRHNGNTGFYAAVEGQATSQLSLFLRGGIARDDFNMVDRYIGSGAIYSGVFAARPDDQIGVALAWARTGKPYRQTTVADDDELTIELTYRAKVSDFLAIQPDFQYVINPGADPTLKNAFVAGLRIELSWGYNSGG